jgi:gamma-glutamyltranspeptidase/glutathione hydrolase
MPTSNWRHNAAAVFRCEKQPASGSKGMVVTNHPLASAAGAEMLAAGGNAIDAAIACLFALTVVEPMMVGVAGGGTAHIRLADGSHRVLDAMSTVPLAATPDIYRPVPGGAADNYDVLDRENMVGAKSVAAPGALRGWCEAQARFGSFPLADVMQPAIRLAARGFAITPYLSSCIREAAHDLSRDPAAAAVYLAGGSVPAAGSRLVNGDYAESLRLIASDGEAALHGGALGVALAKRIADGDGWVSQADLTGYKVMDRLPIRGSYRGWEIVGPPPPAASGVHIVQMLNILEGYDVAGLGFGSAELVHLLAEVLKIAFADRAAATADPDFVAVPVEQLISKDYAAARRALIDPAQTQTWGAGVSSPSSPHTTHVTVADGDGNVVASTQTINSLFGSRIMVPGTGMIPNNYMNNFDPRPGNALSIAPGKRVTTSMSPMMALRDGRVVYALGLPGGKRIFPSAMQALINLIDHGMSLQEAVEAPRVWTEGNALEVEDSFPETVLRGLRNRGHKLQMLPHVAGGMNAIQFHADGSMSGAACWRADGTAIGIGGGLARADARFWPDAPVV